MRVEELRNWCQERRHLIPEEMESYHEARWASLETFEGPPDVAAVVEGANYVGDLGDIEFAKNLLAELENNPSPQPIHLLMEIEAWCDRQKAGNATDAAEQLLNNAEFKYSLAQASGISARSLGETLDKSERDFILTANSQILMIARKLDLCSPNTKSWEAAKFLTSFLAGEMNQAYGVVEQWSVAAAIQRAKSLLHTNATIQQSALPLLDIEIVGPKRDSGAFGQVFPGRQSRLDRDVAVKVIKQDVKPNAVDHALGLAKVSHANVVSVFDVGSVRIPETGELADCVVMEWLPGEKLCDCWKTLSRHEALLIFKQVRCGLDAMHQAGVCHHDLHPGNVMVIGENAKIIDVQYTESARFSRLATAPINSLIEEDCSAFAKLVRDTLWHIGACDPTITERLRNATDFDEVLSIACIALA